MEHECAKKHEDSKDCPAQEVDSECLMEHRSYSGENACSGNKDCRERKPEGAVGGEGGSTKGVISPELPHTRAKLGKTTIEECQADDDSGSCSRKPAGVDAAEDKCSKCKATKAKGSGISDGYHCGFRTSCYNLGHKVPTFH